METFRGSLRHYYRAVIAGGVFGTGKGAEKMSSAPGAPRGTYTPVWMPLHELVDHPVYPRRLASLLARKHVFDAPLNFVDSEGE